MMNQMDDLQRDVGEWAEETFAMQTSASIVAHLAREVAELAANPLSAEEAADCCLLLMDLAHRCGYSLHEAAQAKLAECKRRQWGKPDAEGVVEHLREQTHA